MFKVIVAKKTINYLDESSYWVIPEAELQKFIEEKKNELKKQEFEDENIIRKTCGTWQDEDEYHRLILANFSKGYAPEEASKYIEEKGWIEVEIDDPGKLVVVSEKCQYFIHGPILAESKKMMKRRRLLS